MTEETIHDETVCETREIRKLTYANGGGLTGWRERPVVATVTQPKRRLMWYEKGQPSQVSTPTVNQLADRLKSLQEEGAGDWEVSMHNDGEELTAEGPENRVNFS